MTFKSLDSVTRICYLGTCSFRHNALSVTPVIIPSMLELFSKWKLYLLWEEAWNFNYRNKNLTHSHINLISSTFQSEFNLQHFLTFMLTEMWISCLWWQTWWNRLEGHMFGRKKGSLIEMQCTSNVNVCLSFRINALPQFTVGKTFTCSIVFGTTQHNNTAFTHKDRIPVNRISVLHAWRKGAFHLSYSE